MRVEQSAVGRWSARHLLVVVSGLFAAIGVVVVGVLAWHGWSSVAGASGTVIHVSGTLTSSQTWSPTTARAYVVENVTIPSGDTLTIEPGTVVKVPAGSSYDGFVVDTGGTLDAQGAATDPVLITSNNDSSAAAGGTTGGSGTPAAGNYEHGVTVQAGGTVTLSHTTIHYAVSAIYGYTSTITSPCTGGITVIDSTLSTYTTWPVYPIAGCASPGLVLQNDMIAGHRGVPISGDTSGQAPQIRGNTFDTTYYAIILTTHGDPSGIDLSGTGANHFTGTGVGRTVEVGTSTVTLPAGQTWTIGSAGVVYASSPLTVNGTVTLKPGSIVKVRGVTERTPFAFDVSGGGTLDAQGTATDPVLITSNNDSSAAAGGTTGGSGTPKAGDFPGAVTVKPGGTVTFTHTTIRYAHVPIHGYTSSTTNPCTGGITVTHSTIATYSGTAVTPITGCAVPGLRFDDNAVTGPVGISISSYSESQPLEVRGNTFDTTNAAIELDQSTDPSGIDLSGPDANSFTGTGAGRLVVVNSPLANVPVGQTWAIGTGSIVYAKYPLTVKGSVTLGPGAIVKVQARNAVTFKGFVVATGGNLDAEGTSTDPVLITSSKDSSAAAGGTTGVTGTPAPGNYRYAVTVQAGGTVTFVHTTIRYAQTAIYGYTSSSTSPCTGGITVMHSTIATYSGTAVVPITGCAAPGLRFDDNSVVGPRGIRIRSLSASEPLEIQGNTFDTTDYAIELERDADPCGIDLSGSDANAFTGTGAGRLVVIKTTLVNLPAGQEWSIGKGSIVALTEPLSVKGAINLTPGAIVKVHANTGSKIAGFDVLAGGTINAHGTATDPVLITSSNDSAAAAGGTTGGSGTPKPGDYSRAVTVAAGGTATLTHIRVSYATDAVEASWSSCTSGGSVRVVSSTFGTSAMALFSYAGGTCSPAVPFTFDGRSIPMGTWKVTRIAGTTLTGTQLITPANAYGSSNPSEPCSSCGLSAAGLTAQPKAGDPVNTADGDYTEHLQLVSVPSVGPPLSFTPTYDAHEAQAQAGGMGSPSPLGWGWAYQAAMHLAVTATTTQVTITQENGSQVTYKTATSWSTGGCTTGTSFQCYAPLLTAVSATLEYDKTTATYLLDRGPDNVTVGFDAAGTLASITSPQGQTDTFAEGVTPGTGGCPTATGVAGCTVETDPSGRTLVYQYGSTGRLLGVVSPSGKTWTLAYDASGNLASVTTPTGQVTSFAYDTTDPVASLDHDLTAVTRPDTQPGAPDAGHHITVSYDTTTGTAHVGWATSVTTPGGKTTSFSYTATANTLATATTVTAASGSVTTYRFTGGALYQVTTATGTGQAATTSYQRNSFTELPLDATTTGKTTALSFDATGHLLTETTPGGHTTTNTYGTNGQLLTSTDPLGNTTQYAYTTATDGVPANLRYCTVKPAEYADGVRCPGYGTSATGAATATFDATGNTITTTDPLGRTTHEVYTTTTDGVPPDLRYCTVSPGQWAKGTRCPAYGTSTTGAATRTFDATGNVTSSTTPDGATTTTCYYGDACAPSTAGALGLVYQQTAPSGTTTTDTYDPTGHRTGSTTSFRTFSATTATAYGPTGTPYCTVAPAQYATGVRCPATPPAATAPPAGVTSTYYDATGRVTETVGPTGATSRTAFGPTGKPYCTVAPPAAARGVACPAFATLSVPTPGNDPYPGATIDVYNALGELVTTASPLGAVTTSTYDATGEVATQVVATGTAAAPTVTTSNSYDADGKVTSTTTGTATTKTFYDPTGDAYCTATPNAVAKGTATYHCPAWQASWVNAPPSASSLYSGTTGAKDVTTTFADGDGEQVQTTTPGGHTTLAAFDPTGNAYCTVKPVQVTHGVTCPASVPSSPPTGTATGYTTTLHDATGKVTSVTNPTGTTTTTAYDAAGLRHTVTKGSATTTYCHLTEPCAATAPATAGTGTDLYSTTRPPSQADPTGEVTTTTYTETNQPTTTTTPAVTTTFAYDAAGERTGVTYSTVAAGYQAPSNVTSTYNATGTLATTTTATGTTTDAYDAAGNLTTQSFAPTTGSPLAASSVGYGYAPTGKTTSVTYPSYTGHSDPTVTYAYTSTGQVASVTDWLGHTTTFSYDKAGDLKSTAFANGTTSTSAYDPTGQVTGIALAPTASPSTPLATIAYTRNATTAVTKEADTGALSVTRTYGYDKTGRLSTTGTHPVGYDTATNPTTLPTGAAPTYDAAGELTSSTTGSTTTTLSYDSIGDRTAVTPSTGPTTTYGYDALGQMTSARSTATTGPLSGTGIAFTLNATGLRVGETTSSGTQTLTWDTTGRVPQVLGNGATDFLYGGDGQVVEQVTLATTAPTYLVQDQLGSTRLLTDQAGTVVGTTSFGPYGAATSHSGTTTSPVGFAGGWTTTATGTNYLVHRTETPATGSFTSVDPLVATTTAPYGYGAGDPVNVTDPSGECVTLFGAACLGGGSVTSKVSVGFHPEAAAQAVENFGAGIVGYHPIGAQCNPLENIPYYAGAVFPLAVALIDGLPAAEVPATSEENAGSGAPSLGNIFPTAAGVSVAEGISQGLFTTAPNTAVFWSGLGNDGAEIADQWASENGGVTLNQLMAERGITPPAADDTAGWNAASRAMAENASGTVRAYLGDEMRPKNTWKTIELRALKLNPAVTQVIGVDESTGAETVIFSK